MDYTVILTQLQSATLFDLYRLRIAIERQLDLPERIEPVRARLRPGMAIHYFDETKNRLVPATVLELHRTRLVVDNLEDGQRWSIRICAVQLGDTDANPSSRPAQQPAALDRTSLSVGDRVGFLDRQNQEKYGRVQSLNPKTATIFTNDGQRWRVAYAFLFPVLDVVSEDRI